MTLSKKDQRRREALVDRINNAAEAITSMSLEIHPDRLEAIATLLERLESHIVNHIVSKEQSCLKNDTTR